MNRSEFKRRMQDVYKHMGKLDYYSYSCDWVFKLSKGVKFFADYQVFVLPFLGKDFLKTEYNDESRAKLRMLLLKSFELEVLKTKRYLEY